MIPRACTQFFSSCMVNSCNKLSNETVTAESVDVFNQRLDAEWSSGEHKINYNATEYGTAPGH